MSSLGAGRSWRTLPHTQQRAAGGRHAFTGRSVTYIVLKSCSLLIFRTHSRSYLLGNAQTNELERLSKIHYHRR